MKQLTTKQTELIKGGNNQQNQITTIINKTYEGGILDIVLHDED